MIMGTNQLVKPSWQCFVPVPIISQRFLTEKSMLSLTVNWNYDFPAWRKRESEKDRRQLLSTLSNCLRLRHVFAPWTIVRMASSFCVPVPLRSPRWNYWRGTWMLQFDAKTD